MFGVRSGLVNNKIVKQVGEEEKKKELAKKAGEPKSQYEMKASGSDSKYKDGLLANFSWDYNPLDFIIRKAPDDDLTNAKFKWQDKADPNVKII